MTKRTPLLLGRQQMNMTPVRQKGKLSLELRRRLGCPIVFCVNRYKYMVNAVNETPHNACVWSCGHTFLHHRQLQIEAPAFSSCWTGTTKALRA